MSIRLGAPAPDFEAQSTEGPIRFHEWIGDSWAVLFSHPKDYTPVCTTELGYMAKIKPEFDARGVKIIGLSVDPVDKHADWARDIEETQGVAPRLRSGLATATVGYRSRWSWAITPSHEEASAHAPCTRTVVGFAAGALVRAELCAASSAATAIDVAAATISAVLIRCIRPRTLIGPALGDG